jgi:putative addiction module component (TIGR02574 family)
MVNPALQAAIEAMSLDERPELVECIESTVESTPIDVPEEQKATIRSRAAELDADPSIGLTWDLVSIGVRPAWPAPSAPFRVRTLTAASIPGLETWAFVQSAARHCALTRL